MSDEKKPRGRPRKTEPTEPTSPVVNPPAAVAPQPPAGLQFKLPAGELLTALRSVERVLPKKTTLPVLTFFGVEGKGDQLTITATDLERAVWRTVMAQVGAPGKICLPPLATDVIAGLDADAPVYVQVTAKTCTAKLNVGTLQAALKGIDGTEFPLIGTGGLENVVTIQLTGFQVEEILKRIAPFVATDDARPILTGIAAQFNYPAKDDPAAAVKFISADGFRAAELTLFDVPIQFGKVNAEGWLRSVIIPVGAFTEAQRLAKDQDDDTLLTLQVWLKPTITKEKDGATKTTYLGEGYVTVTGSLGGLQFTLIEGTFPQVDRVLSGAEIQDCKIIPLPVEDTLGALARTAAFAAESLDTVRVKVNVPGKTTTFAASAAESGDVVESVASEFGDRAPADGFTIGLNVNYLGSLVKAVTWNDGAVPAQMLVMSPNAPVFFKIPGYRSAVMPMHLNTGDAKEKPADPQASKPVEPVASQPAESVVATQSAPAPTTPANGAGKPVTCPCGKSLNIVPGGADVCDCGKIVDAEGNVVG